LQIPFELYWLKGHWKIHFPLDKINWRLKLFDFMQLKQNIPKHDKQLTGQATQVFESISLYVELGHCEIQLVKFK
jgi:hypothetical protein